MNWYCVIILHIIISSIQNIRISMTSLFSVVRTGKEKQIIGIGPPHPRHPVQAVSVSSKSLSTVCLPQLRKKKTAEKEKRISHQGQDSTGDMKRDKEKRNIQKHPTMQQRARSKTGNMPPLAQRLDGLNCTAPHLNRRAKPTCVTVRTSRLCQGPEQVPALPLATQNMLLLICRSRGGSW